MQSGQSGRPKGRYLQEELERNDAKYRLVTPSRDPWLHLGSRSAPQPRSCAENRLKSRSSFENIPKINEHPGSGSGLRVRGLGARAEGLYAFIMMEKYIMTRTNREEYKILVS